MELSPQILELDDRRIQPRDVWSVEQRTISEFAGERVQVGDRSVQIPRRSPAIHRDEALAQLHYGVATEFFFASLFSSNAAVRICRFTTTLRSAQQNHRRVNNLFRPMRMIVSISAKLPMVLTMNCECNHSSPKHSPHAFRPRQAMTDASNATERKSNTRDRPSIHRNRYPRRTSMSYTALQTAQQV